MVFDAALWRDEQAQRRGLVLAWYVAALGRAKKMPTLKRLLDPPKTRRLVGAEKIERGREFEELTERLSGKAKPNGR